MQLLDDQVESLLHHAEVGRLACYDGEYPYVVPLAYVYDGSAILCHTWMGRKVEAMRRHPGVCFQVDRVLALNHWQSVVVRGIFEELSGQAAEEALRRLGNRLQPLLPGERSRPARALNPSDTHAFRGREEIVFRVRITERSGRYETPR